MKYRPIIFCVILSFLSFGCRESAAIHDHEEETHEGHDHSHDADDGDHDHSHKADVGVHEHPGAFNLDKGVAEKFGIETSVVSPGKFSEIVATTGRIEPSPADRQTITARGSGIFTPNNGIMAGAKVKSGETIGTISSRGLEGGDVNAAAEANLQSAQKEYERIAALYKKGLSTVAELNEAERRLNEAKSLAGAQSKGGVITLTSPFEGTLTSLLVERGEYVDAGSPVAVIIKNNIMTLRADLPERYAASAETFVNANIRPAGSEETVPLSEYNVRRVSGEGSLIAENGYIPVYFTFSSNPYAFAGSYAEVYLIGKERDNVVTVPKDALLEIQGNKYVYVVKHGHAYEKRLVKTGATDGLNVEIKSGIRPGETIVSKGASVVRMAETSAIAPPAHNHEH